MYVTNCTICGQLFEHRFPKQHVCEDCKNRPCEVCGKLFKRIEPYDQKCCSKECRMLLVRDPERNRLLNEQRKKRIQEKYGVDNVSQIAEVKSKIRKSKIDPEGYVQEKIEERELAKVTKNPLIRSCVICGKEFEAVGSQTTCPGPHYKTCIICGNQFPFKNASNKRQTCSRKCASQLRKHSIQEVTQICEWCGKEFHSNSNASKYCDGPHFKKCEVCGKEFEINLKGNSSIKGLSRTCSEECKQKLTIKTCIDKYGVERASMTPEAREHNRKKFLENQEWIKEINLERWGFPYAAQNPEIRKRLSAKTSDPEVQHKTQQTNLSRYGVTHAMKNSDIARKHSGSQFKQVACDGTRVDSRWEALIYDFLVRNNIEFEYNTTSLSVEYNGVNHVTHIDFKIGDLLVEVKGSHLLKGTYGDKLEVPIEAKLDVYKKNHVVIVTDNTCADVFGKPNSKISNGLKYLDKCPHPLIGVDIDLFDHPEFPYQDGKPPCFYDVKVDGNRSAFEAFYDEKIRWKMILNRINYSGGFINAKQVLTAMNVTRTCKQPSWFSKSLAYRIIQNYCTSDTIVDCFAGWGMRHDAAIELNKSYIGIDFNPQLIQWHHSKGRNIQLNDAKIFKYNKECSVFICPPYSDPATGRCFEDYNFEGFDNSAKALSQCDWLKLIMKNVPNANEYVMVCKIIDPGFEKYIIETLTNKSHLGSNNEYILVVPNKKL